MPPSSPDHTCSLAVRAYCARVAGRAAEAAARLPTHDKRVALERFRGECEALTPPAYKCYRIIRRPPCPPHLHRRIDDAIARVGGLQEGQGPLQEEELSNTIFMVIAELPDDIVENEFFLPTINHHEVLRWYMAYRIAHPLSDPDYASNSL